VTVAFTPAYIVGIYIHLNIKEIKIKKYGKKTEIIIQTGLDGDCKHFAQP
jgi:hypothetical protein